MGHKVHPYGFRLGINKDWQAKWYADKDFAQLLKEDLTIRAAVNTRYHSAGISTIEIGRQGNDITVAINTSRPGIVIGRGGQRVEELGRHLRNLLSRKVQVNIREIRQPELDAKLVAEEIASALSRRVTFRRAMRRAMGRTMDSGAKGIKVICSGRLGGLEIARSVKMREGRVPLHTLRADIDYGLAEAHTLFGRIGVKVWIYKGDTLPQRSEKEMASPVVAPAGEEAPAPVAVAAVAPAPAPVAPAAGAAVKEQGNAAA